MMSIPTSRLLKAIKEYQTKYVDDDFEQPEMIISKLRAYQQTAIKWIMDREKNNDLVKSDGSKFSGGILADDIGLGKTVEMLCSILANSSPQEFYCKKIMITDSINDNQDTLIATTSKSLTRKYISHASKINIEKQSVNHLQNLLNNWNKNSLNINTISKNSFLENTLDDGTLTVECCTDTSSDNTLVFCAVYGKTQHASCANINPIPFQKVPFLCAICWTLTDKNECKAALIVVPESVISQWIDEIEKHIKKPGLNVLIYNGVHLDDYIQPISFNNYDLVITSYTKAPNDLNYAGKNLEIGRTTRLRHSKIYKNSMSPLPCIKWWRICLDEAQGIKSGVRKVSEMISGLKSVHRWAMTGIPVHESFDDLYGIFKFLDVSPYCDREQFSVFMKDQNNLIYLEWFSKIIWRNSVEDVNSELNLPIITTKNHLLTFSDIEKYYYIREHYECTKLFNNITNRLSESLDISLKHIDKRTVNSINNIFTKLRKSCIHPKDYFGQLLTVKPIRTMEKYVDEMIIKYEIECNNTLYCLVSKHNSIAGYYITQSNPSSAVNHYREVLSLMKEYKEKNIKVDVCQKIHVLYNLTKVLDEHTELSKITDENLKNELEQLEKEYLDAKKQIAVKENSTIDLTLKTIKFYSNQIEEIIHDRPLEYSYWWCYLLKDLDSSEFTELMSQVKAILKYNYCCPFSFLRVHKKWKSVESIVNILSNWLAELNYMRNEIFKVLSELKNKSITDLLESAHLCHLPVVKLNALNRSQCFLCDVRVKFENYRWQLFSINNHQKKSKYLKIQDDDNIVYNLITGEVKCLKITREEFLLIKLLQYGQAKKNKNSDYLKNGTEHMKVLTLVRKEFRYLQLLWIHMNHNISNHHDIFMAKRIGGLSLVLDDILQSEINANGLPKKNSKVDHVNAQIKQLETGITLCEGLFKEKTAILYFHEYLKREEVISSHIECPICKLIIGPEWAVLHCGHSLCRKCLATMCGNYNELSINCPICRKFIILDSICYVKSNQEEMPNIKIEELFSTKIQNITETLMELIVQDPKVKVLIFSTWRNSLQILAKAFKKNSVNFKILRNKTKYNKSLNDFKTNANINAFLMPLSLESTRLNLTEATQVFFIDPIINKTDQYQIIRRIQRIGQTKPICVHNFIIRDSIEENITNILSSNLLDKWDDITLNQMVELFKKSPLANNNH